MLIEDVAEVIREVATVEVVNRFQTLTDDEIIEKSPGDLVTIADRECERVLGERLRQIRDVPVVGEEATAADSSLLALVDSAPAVWIVDPVDGTKNFVKGSPNFAVMVSFVEAGRTETAWVWHPISDRMYTARQNGGVQCNGEPVVRPHSDEAMGIIKRGYMSEDERNRLAPPPASIGREVPAVRCAGVEYTMLARGEIDFLFYYRTWPWDHSPGGIIAQEAGLRVARLDGSDYRPGDGRNGLLSATPELWQPLADHINAALEG